MWGAVTHFGLVTPEISARLRHAMQQVGGISVTTWNDDVNRTKDDVIAALECAASFR